MPSNPGQNLHLVSSQIHAVASSSHLANSSSQLVVLSSYLVESSSHLVVSSILLTSPLLVYSSVILQLVVSPFNSSCHTSTRRSLYPYILARRLDTRSLVEKMQGVTGRTSTLYQRETLCKPFIF